MQRADKKPLCQEVHLQNQDKTISINPLISDAGVQFLPLYIDKLIGIVRKKKANNAAKKKQ